MPWVRGHSCEVFAVYPGLEGTAVTCLQCTPGWRALLRDRQSMRLEKDIFGVVALASNLRSLVLVSFFL